MKMPNNILIIRNDKLGDFMLAYPTFNVVSKLFPSAKIYALIPEYTKPMAKLCQWIDGIIIDESTKGISGVVKTTAELKKHHIDAALCLHSSPRIALSLFLAGIPHRFAPASRLDQIFYNHRLTQRRSRSEKPEFEYNIDLANFMGEQYSLPPAIPDKPPYLEFSTKKVDQYRETIFEQYHLTNNQNIVIVHAGSGGSAVNITIDQYAELVTLLSTDKSLFFIITAGPDEEKVAQRLSSLIKTSNHAVYYSSGGLNEFSKLLSLASLFISGSTGVLHIAGALDIPTVAFYPSKKSATSLRWKTLNSKQKHTAFTLTNKGDGEPEIDIKQASQTISNEYFN